MLFNRVEFHGRVIPGMKELSTLLPRKLQEIPGIMQGGSGGRESARNPAAED